MLFEVDVCCVPAFAKMPIFQTHGQTEKEGAGIIATVGMDVHNCQSRLSYTLQGY